MKKISQKKITNRKYIRKAFVLTMISTLLFTAVIPVFNAELRISINQINNAYYNSGNDPEPINGEPIISNIDANPDPQKIGGYVEITCNVTDPDGVDEVFLNITDPNNIYQNFSITANKTGDTYYCNKTYDVAGEYIYFIWANDTNGNFAVSSIYNFKVIRWNVVLNVTETSGKYDTAIFGEVDDALDGQDIYDIPKPPSPGHPYIRAWFDAGLASPYNELWADYRDYPDTDESWDLYIKTNNTPPIGDTDVDITWNTDDINETEYGKVELWDETVKLADMKTEKNYTFNASFDSSYHLIIKCFTGPYLLSLLTNGTGSGTCEANSSGPFYYGDSVMIWANASVGSSFTGFYGDLSGTVSPQVLIIFGDSSVTAEFTEFNLILLKTNWNLISLPFNESVNKANIIVSYDNTNYSWNDAVTNNIVLNFIYYWNKTNQNYQLKDILEPGYGYWVYAYHDCNLILSGNISDSYITELNQKWNIMGIPFNVSLPKEDLIIIHDGTEYTWQEAVDNLIILGFIYNWNRNSQTYTLADDFNPGYGYWMYAYYDCTLKK